jgi:predicted acetyltransferase
MAIEVRTPALEEVERYIEVHRTGFNSYWAPDRRARNIEYLSAPTGQTLHAAYDGSEMVGTAMSIPLTVTVPGGAAIPASGLTWVATLPNHRRRGVMAALLDAHLALAREQGAVASVLDAVESALYARYGYGVATYDVEVTIPTAHITFREPPTGRQIRFAEAADSVAVMQRVWHAAQRQRSGMTNRPDPEVEWWADKHEGFLIVAADDAGEVDGYATYTVDERWSPMQHADNKVKVGELIASSTEAYAALWSTLIALDMATEVVARYRPVDELLPHLVTAPRRIDRSHLADSLWLRPLDVPALLAARSYRPGPACVVEVDGERLRVDPADGSVTPTDAAADVTMTAAAFGALVLGGPGATVLARAGRVAGDAERADALLGWSHAPWSPLQF